MKILHTADWHLGAKIEGASRIEEQRLIMKEISTIANIVQKVFKSFKTKNLKSFLLMKKI